MTVTPGRTAPVASVPLPRMSPELVFCAKPVPVVQREKHIGKTSRAVPRKNFLIDCLLKILASVSRSLWAECQILPTFLFANDSCRNSNVIQTTVCLGASEQQAL